MTERSDRIKACLKPDHARKLASRTERDASRITEILDGIPGAWERAQASIERARRGETVPQSDL